MDERVQAEVRAELQAKEAELVRQREVLTRPYAEQGTLISAENWRRFQQLMAGQGGTFAVLLN